MSRYIVEDAKTKWVYGWDQGLLTFFLQKHDKTLTDEDFNPVEWHGTNPEEIYEVDDLVIVARKAGIDIPHATRVALYGDKDDGK